MRAPMTRRRLLSLICGIALLAGLTAWRLMSSRSQAPGGREAASLAPAGNGAELVTFGGQSMGTTYSVRTRLPLGTAIDTAERAVAAALESVERCMSTYRPSSELSGLNRAPQGAPVPVSEDLWQVLALAEQVHGQTRGAFDVTVGPLVAAWGFGAAAQPEPPDAANLDLLRRRVGMQHLELDAAARTVEKQVAGMSIDLSAIAKGYGVDEAAQALEQLAVEHYMVEVGGEVRTRGRPEPGRHWVLGIEEPTSEARRVYGRLPLGNAALATSGDYRNFRREGNEWISHTLDPRTGRPVARRTASVSVVAERAAEADALATALGVLSPSESLALAEEHGWPVLLLVHSVDGFVPMMSASFKKLGFEVAARAAGG